MMPLIFLAVLAGICLAGTVWLVLRGWFGEAAATLFLSTVLAAGPLQELSIVLFLVLVCLAVPVELYLCLFRAAFGPDTATEEAPTTEQTSVSFKIPREDHWERVISFRR